MIEADRNQAARTIQRSFHSYLNRKHLLPFSAYKYLYQDLQWAMKSCRLANAFLWKYRNVTVVSQVLSYYGRGREQSPIYIYKNAIEGIVSFVFPELPKERVGEGRLKTYTSSRTADLPLPRSQKQYDFFPSVLMDVRDSSDLDMVREGVSAHALLYRQAKPADVYLAKPCRELCHDRFTVERYWGCGEKAIREGMTPQVWKLLLRDMTKTVLWLQDQKLYHLDINWKNFLIDQRNDHEGKNRPIANLTDWDTLSRGGAPTGVSRPYERPVSWDPCCLYGIVTPFVGYYGLITCHTKLWGYPDREFYLKRDAILTDILRGNQPPAYSCPGFREERGPIWNLFLLICQESSLLLRRFSQIKGPITEAMLQEALKETQADAIKQELLALCEVT